MEISIRSQRRFSNRVDRARLARIAARAVRLERDERGLTVYVTDDAEMRNMNRRFHHTDRSTDVLSFPSAEPSYLGDIVISFERARAQAARAGWRVGDELELLVVHGILHLLGYDDLSPRSRRAMWVRQRVILGHAVKGEEL